MTKSKPKKTYSDEYKANRRKNQLLWLEKKRQDPEWVKQQSENKKAYRNKGKQMTTPVEPVSVEDDIQQLIEADKCRINDLRFFMDLQNISCKFAERGLRVMVKDLASEGRPLSPEFAEMVIAQDFVAMAKHFHYQLNIKVTPRNGDPRWVGPLHYKGLLFTHNGDMRPDSSIPKVVAEAQMKYATINTSKKNITGGNK
mgnify:FL=1